MSEVEDQALDETKIEDDAAELTVAQEAFEDSDDESNDGDDEDDSDDEEKDD